MQLVLDGRTSLALEALVALSADGGRVPGGTLAGSIGTSLGYLPQVLAPMISAGWIESARGPGGGYRLTTGLEVISMLDVIEAYEGDLVARCALKGIPCPEDDTCPLHATWEAVARALAGELGSRTVKDLFHHEETT